MLPPGLYAQSNNLNYYIRHALENSPLLKEYQSQMVINRLDSLILKADYKPSVDFSTTNFWAPIINDLGYDEAITHKGRNNAILTVRQTIIGQGNLKNRLNSYTLDNQSLQNAKSISEQDLKLAVTTQYITAYGMIQEILFNEEIINRLDKESIVLKKLTETTLYKQTDYLHFHVALQQQQLLVSRQKADYKNNLALLNYLCGISDTSFVWLENPGIMLQPSPSFENTLQYYRFQIDSLKIRNSDALIDYAYRPKLDVFADAGFNSTLANYTYHHFGASIGFSLTVPIYDGNQRQKQHNKLKISEQIRKDYQDFSRQQYRQQLEQLYQQLEQTEEIINQAQSVILSTQMLIDAYGKQMQTGDVSITDYMLSINNYLNAKHVITQHTINKIQIINQINYWNHEK
jgi:outer membrane protein TolC